MVIAIVSCAVERMDLIQWPKVAKAATATAATVGCDIYWPKVVKDAEHISLRLAEQEIVQKDKEIKALRTQIRTLQTQLVNMAAKDDEIRELRTQFAMELAVKDAEIKGLRKRRLW